MAQSTPGELKAKIQAILDRWDFINEDITRNADLGRVEQAHLRVLDRFEEELMALYAISGHSDPQLKTCCDAVEVLRARVVRKLRHEKTVTNLPISEIK